MLTDILSLLRLLGCINTLGQLPRRFGEFLYPTLNRGLVVAFNQLLQISDCTLYALLLVGFNLVAQLGDRFLGRVYQCLGLVAGAHQLLKLFILLSVLLGILNHVVNLRVG